MDIIKYLLDFIAGAIAGGLTVRYVSIKKQNTINQKSKGAMSPNILGDSNSVASTAKDSNNT